MAVTTQDVLKIAGLARLKVEDAQLPQLTEQLNSILGHMEVLSRVDTAGVAPTMGGGFAEGMRLRADEVGPVPLERDATSLTADARDGFILVPRLATHEDV